MTKAHIILASMCVLLASCSNNSGLPKCDSAEAKQLIEEIVAGKNYSFGDFVSTKNISEDGFNEDSQIRTCSADLVTTKINTPIYYSIIWADAEHQQYKLEMRANQ